MILNEAADVASRKRAVQFLVNNFDRCFPLDKRKIHMTDEMKKHEAEEYIRTSVQPNYCHTFDINHNLSWTKNLVEGLVRILKLECNDDTDRPANKKMMEQLKKLYFAATMYRQKQMWDGKPQAEWITTNLNGWNFYQLNRAMAPFYEEALSIYTNGYGDKFKGKTVLEDEANHANEVRANAIQQRLDAGEEVSEEDQQFLAAWNEGRNALENQNANHDEDAYTDPAVFGDHVPYMEGKFRVGNKGYWAVRIDTHAQSKTWCWWTYPNCPCDQEPNGAQWCITLDNPGNWNGYGLGRTQACYYVFKDGFEKLDREESGNTATQPYDEWGESLICVRISKDPEPEDTLVAGFCSRYNHFGHGHRNLSHEDGFADEFCDHKIDKFCEIIGCTKEEFCEKFRFITGNANVKFTPDELYRNLDANDAADTVHYRLSKWNYREKLSYLVYDEETGLFNVVVNNRLRFTEWVKSIGESAKNKFGIVMLEGIDGRLQFCDANGNTILPKPLNLEKVHTPFYFIALNEPDVPDYVVIVDLISIRTAIYSIKRKKYVTNGFINGFFRPLNSRTLYFIDAMIQDDNPDNRDVIFKFNIKTGKMEPVNTNTFNDGVSANDSFIWDDTHVKVRETGEVVFVDPQLRSIQMIGTVDHWVLPDGTQKYLKDSVSREFMENGHRVGMIVTDGKNSVLIVGQRNAFNATRAIAVVKPTGELLFEETLLNNEHIVKDSINNFETGQVIYKCVGNITVEVWFITPTSIKVVEGPIKHKSTPISISGFNLIYWNSSEIYDYTGKVIATNSIFNDDNINEIFEFGHNANVLRVLCDHGEYLYWVKTNKVYEMKDIASWTASFGHDYIMVKDGYYQYVLDDEGRQLYDAPPQARMNIPFNEDGVASTKSEDETIYFNLDNEWGTDLLEVLESMNRRKLATLLETKQVETPYQRILRLASSLC